VKLTELFDAYLYLSMRELGYVREQIHPAFSELRILNYTEKAQYDGRWNEVTEQCRGLIFNYNSGQIVARPFKKFFNFGQTNCPEIDMEASAVVMDKMDGSLGILYKQPDGKYAIATRGSFSSDQAIHATKVLNDKYGAWLSNIRNQELFEEYTVLFEIIYPENRIVCDYAEMDDLVLLDAVNVETGDSWGSDAASVFLQWRGPVAKEFEYYTFKEALEAEHRVGAEGFVILFPETGERVKIKQLDYIELHRLVTGLNERVIWEKLSAGENIEGFIENLPDEFHGWVKDVAGRLKQQVVDLTTSLTSEYNELISSFTSEVSRRDFAMQASKSPNKWAMFALLDGKDISSEVWKRCRPEGNKDALRVQE
jgi:RNA ligase